VKPRSAERQDALTNRGTARGATGGRIQRGSFGAAVLAVILQRGLAGHDRAAAFDQAFWWSLGFTALAVLPALLLPGRRDARSTATAERAIRT
jgi:hypothetical protein